MSPKEVEEYFSDKSLVPELKIVDVDYHKVNIAIQDNQKNATVVFIHGAPGSWSAFIDFMKNGELRKMGG